MEHNKKVRNNNIIANVSDLILNLLRFYIVGYPKYHFTKTYQMTSSKGGKGGFEPYARIISTL
jgi:hypothetical protein